MGDRVVYVGHATALLEQDGARILTDPTLRDRMGHLTRRVGTVDESVTRDLDAVLISHVHQDHLDLPSLRLLDPELPIVVPVGGGKLAAKGGFRDIHELAVGARVTIGPLEIEAVPAAHPGRRPPLGIRAEAVGYVISGANRTYFAGDTDLFDGMESIGSALDLALIPVWGWGPTVGTGHLDPAKAARALTMLRPRIAVPLHWGTFFPLPRRGSERLTEPPLEFARAAASSAPEVDVRVLRPGEATTIDRR
jgi:L-ascorbate metabolism protein UlaG (beta-lactamase superfamily)